QATVGQRDQPEGDRRDQAEHPGGRRRAPDERQTVDDRRYRLMSHPFGAIIAGTGSCVPERRLTNDDLSKLVDTNDEWIVQRTGIRERRIAGEGESTATLATAAARKALAAAEMDAN